ncbi:unnamed protein product, partial [Mesorhabditis belari]|uniref:MULE transposase domain-containing protein n=1 Tax=Mesorhabditis belari TaxID=2138241 RepID=A0AAF3F2I6_9BILA
MLLQRSIWSIDGTFHAAPFGFSQILVIGVEIEHLFVPCAYAFLSSKLAQTYSDVFGLVKQLGAPLPTKIKTELTIFNGFMAVYGNTATIHFCFFLHFFKAIFFKIKEKKLQEICCDPNTFVYVKGFLALTFIKPVDVLQYFRPLRDEASKQIPSIINVLQGLYLYFEKPFVGFVQNSRFIRPSNILHSNVELFDTICRGEQLDNSSRKSYNSLLKALTSRYSAH